MNENDIKKFRNIIQAGKSTLNEIEIQEVTSKISLLLGSYTSDEYSNVSSVEEILFLLDAIIEGGFVSDLMTSFSEESYFKFGQSIKEAMSNSDIELSDIHENLSLHYLNLLRYSEFSTKITDSDKWTKLISELIDLSNFNTRKLFKQRVDQYSKKTLFNVIQGTNVKALSWTETN